MKRALAILTLVAALAAFNATTSTAGAVGSISFVSTTMTGDQEVVPVDTAGSGQAYFVLNERNETIRYLMFGARITGVTESHIHLAGPGVNGPIAVFLFDFNGNGINPADPPGTDRSFFFASGLLTQSDLDAVDPGNDINDLMDAMKTGQAYVNVHTLANPGGEIRGQIS